MRLQKNTNPSFEILDSTLREGIQAVHPLYSDQGIVFSEKQTLLLTDLLMQFGVDYIEIGAPVRSKFSRKIIKRIVKKATDTNTRVVIHTRCVADDIKEVLELDVDGINLFLHAAKHKNISREEGIRILRYHFDLIDKFSSRKIIKRFSFEDSFRTPLPKIGKAVFALDAKTERLGVPDTTGTAEPKEVRKVFSYLHNSFPELELECHFHNDLGLAIANAQEAVKAGCKIIDTTILGIGERNGIVPISGLCAVLSKYPIYKRYMQKKYNLQLLSQIDESLAEMLEITVPFNMPLTSPGFFSHVSGVHANGYAENHNLYESLHPKDFGKKIKVLWASAVVGKSSILHRANQLKVDLSESEASKIADEVRETAKKAGSIKPNTVDQMIMKFKN